jgi:ribulose kinase
MNTYDVAMKIYLDLSTQIKVLAPDEATARGYATEKAIDIYVHDGIANEELSITSEEVRLLSPATTYNRLSEQTQEGYTSMQSLYSRQQETTEESSSGYTRLRTL